MSGALVYAAGVASGAVGMVLVGLCLSGRDPKDVAAAALEEHKDTQLRRAQAAHRAHVARERARPKRQNWPAHDAAEARAHRERLLGLEIESR